MIRPDEVVSYLTELFPEAKCELEFSTPFELLIAVILSAQCTDKRVNAVTRELFKKYNKPEQFALLDQKTLEKEIYSCGFYSNKAKNIINASKDIVQRFGGVVPKTQKELTSLAGVGMKTAKVVLAVAYAVPGIAVDTHVGRVARRLNLTKNEDPDKVSVELESKFDKREWNNLHYRLVLFGRYKCKSQNPECEGCKFAKNCNFVKNKVKK